MTETTKVRFDLWLVLGFIILLGGVVSGFLYDALATGKKERLASQQHLTERLVKLETNYIYIMSGLDKLERGNDKLIDALSTHERNTMKLIRNGSGGK
jgi:hypothetical protein